MIFKGPHNLDPFKVYSSVRFRLLQESKPLLIWQDHSGNASNGECQIMMKVWLAHQAAHLLLWSLVPEGQGRAAGTPGLEAGGKKESLSAVGLIF